jgi:hypothetical protein
LNIKKVEKDRKCVELCDFISENKLIIAVIYSVNSKREKISSGTLIVPFVYKAYSRFTLPFSQTSIIDITGRLCNNLNKSVVKL